MPRRRWIATESTPANQTATLTGPQALHFTRVLRGEPGTECDVIVGGQLWRATVTQATEDKVNLRLGEQLPADPALPLTLLLAVFKFDRFEWAIEKATELGVQRIAPIIAQRTDKHLAQAANKRVERWRRIAHEAAQQSRRAQVPNIADPTPLATAIVQPKEGAKLLLAENEQTRLLRDAIPKTDQPITLAIGPEGGWTNEELMLFQEEKWQPVSLGPTILRAETAVIAAIAVAASQLLKSKSSGE